MLISIIVAMDRLGMIGDGTAMPWRQAKDLRRFRELTWGKPIIMGRATFESIGKPLPGRLSIVLSSKPEFNVPGCRIAHTLQEALATAEECLASVGGTEAMIIGGGRVYADALERWDRLYLTLVHGEFNGNTYFPVRELLRQTWRPAREPEMHSANEKNPFAHSFYVLERVRDENKAVEFAEDTDLDAILRSGTILASGGR